MQLDYDRLDPELTPMLEAFPPLDINRDNIVAIRELLASRPAPPSLFDVSEERRQIDGPDGPLDVILYRASDKPRQAALQWIHGGGYILGSADDERARMIAAELDCTVCSVDYRLAPEHPFPAGSEDCYAALLWLRNNAADLGVDAARLAIGGASAGGGLAAGLALMNRDRDNVPLTLQLLIYPMIDNLHATASGQFENHPVWKRSTSFNAWEMYLDGVPGDAASPYAAATRATDLTGVPPAYVCVGTEDLFYNEDVEYAVRLNEAGVACELAVFPGLFHGADAFLPAAAVSQRLSRSFLAALSSSFGSPATA
ncbi:MAG: alpha/beta hydrolase [Pseudomonadota bacterium]